MIVERGITLMRGVENLIVEVADFSNTQVKYFVKNTPVCQYDQHSRARVGVKFMSYEVDEEPRYVMYTKLYDKLIADKAFMAKTVDTLLSLEVKRNKAKFQTDYNLMSRSCQYFVIQDISSLMGQMERRLQFCEESFITGLHWLLRDKLIKLGIHQANLFLPGCDAVKRCTYSQSDYLSQAFGCLFSGCGRWKDTSQYASFNQSCTDAIELEKQLKIEIPKSTHEVNEKIR